MNEESEDGPCRSFHRILLVKIALCDYYSVGTVSSLIIKNDYRVKAPVIGYLVMTRSVFLIFINFNAFYNLYRINSDIRSITNLF